jgi:thioredoxin 1
MTELQIFTMDNWEKQVLYEENPVLVDFQTPWCLPLILQRDALTKLAEEVKAHAKTFKLDVSRQIGIAMNYRLIDFPTLSLFKKGKLLKSCLGSGRINAMKLVFDEYLASNDKKI